MSDELERARRYRRIAVQAYQDGAQAVGDGAMKRAGVLMRRYERTGGAGVVTLAACGG